MLGNILSGKGVTAEQPDRVKRARGILRAGEGILSAGEGTSERYLKKNQNFEINDYYKNEPKFNGVFSRNNLPKKMKKRAYIVNLDEYDDIGTHWVALYHDKNTAVYFDSFGIEHIPDEIMKFVLKNKEIKTNIFRIQAYDSIMCGYFCIGFIDYMIKGKDLIDYTNIFSPTDFDKNDRIIYVILKYKWNLMSYQSID